MSDGIKAGDRVRSYAFPDSDIYRRHLNYIEGTVERIDGRGPDCPRYVIRVERQVWDGVEIDRDRRGNLLGQHVYPPVNGTPTLFGRICDGVVKV